MKTNHKTARTIKPYLAKVRLSADELRQIMVYADNDLNYEYVAPEYRKLARNIIKKCRKAYDSLENHTLKPQ